MMRGRNGLILTVFGLLVFFFCRFDAVKYGSDFLASASIVVFSFGLSSVIVAILIRIWRSA